MKARLELLFLIPLAVVVTLAGCQKGNFAQRQSETDKLAFRYALTISPTTFDPARVQDIETLSLLSNIFEPLVSYNESSQIQPQLAETWSISKDGKTYTFRLNKAAKFHNGSAVTAEDVKATFERNASQEYNSPTASLYLGDIAGYEAFATGKSDSLSGVKIIDPHTVEITTDAARPYFLGKLTYAPAWILPKETPRKEITDSIGTGAYKLENYITDQEVSLSAFADYYQSKAKTQAIIAPIVKDASTRNNMFRRGELDYMSVVRQDLQAWEADPATKGQVFMRDRPAVFYFGLNQKVYKPFEDARVRRAISMGINREKLVGDIVKGMTVANGLVPPGISSHQPGYKGIPFDPKQANELLAGAGYPRGSLPSLKLYYREQNPDTRIVVESVASQLKENLGIEISLQSMEWRTFLEARNKGQLSMYYLSWFADYLDPQNFLSILFDSQSKQNSDGYKNVTFDELARKADVETDPVKRVKMYQEAEDMLVQSVARIPLFFYREPGIKSKRVQGLKFNLFGPMPFKEVVIAP